MLAESAIKSAKGLEKGARANFADSLKPTWKSAPLARFQVVYYLTVRVALNSEYLRYSRGKFGELVAAAPRSSRVIRYDGGRTLAV